MSRSSGALGAWEHAVTAAPADSLAVVVDVTYPKAEQAGLLYAIVSSLKSVPSDMPFRLARIAELVDFEADLGAGYDVEGRLLGYELRSLGEALTEVKQAALVELNRTADADETALRAYTAKQSSAAVPRELRSRGEVLTDVEQSELVELSCTADADETALRTYTVNRSELRSRGEELTEVEQSKLVELSRTAEADETALRAYTVKQSSAGE
ncbi:hypothetical protein T492DRAFT_878965 [Pavlovales sp. CCMP2436]|nr:hypothetical protein T492DRAFT_878965 [Pavlovales sp. CCMP2436]